MVPVEGIEPPTFGLQNRCSTAELNRRGVGDNERGGPQSRLNLDQRRQRACWDRCRTKTLHEIATDLARWTALTKSTRPNLHGLSSQPWTVRALC